MSNSNLPDSELLKSLLEPLLDDFQHWFEGSRHLLEVNDLAFLGADQQASLLARVITAQQEVSTARLLLNVTDGQVGVEVAVLAPWHRLVHECWQVSIRFRQEQAADSDI